MLPAHSVRLWSRPYTDYGLGLWRLVLCGHHTNTNNYIKNVSVSVSVSVSGTQFCTGHASFDRVDVILF